MRDWGIFCQSSESCIWIICESVWESEWWVRAVVFVNQETLSFSLPLSPTCISASTRKASVSSWTRIWRWTSFLRICVSASSKPSRPPTRPVSPWSLDTWWCDVWLPLPPITSYNKPAVWNICKFLQKNNMDFQKPVSCSFQLVQNEMCLVGRKRNTGTTGSGTTRIGSRIGDWCWYIAVLISCFHVGQLEKSHTCLTDRFSNPMNPISFRNIDLWPQFSWSAQCVQCVYFHSESFTVLHRCPRFTN